MFEALFFCLSVVKACPHTPTYPFFPEANYTPRNEVVGGYTGFTMSVRPSVDKSYVVR